MRSLGAALSREVMTECCSAWSDLRQGHSKSDPHSRYTAEQAVCLGEASAALGIGWWQLARLQPRWQKQEALGRGFAWSWHRLRPPPGGLRWRTRPRKPAVPGWRPPLCIHGGGAQSAVQSPTTLESIRCWIGLSGSSHPSRKRALETTAVTGTPGHYLQLSSAASSHQCARRKAC